MASKGNESKDKKRLKKTRQGRGKGTKYGCKGAGGGPEGSTKSKHYKKKSRGQGK